MKTAVVSIIVLGLVGVARADDQAPAATETDLIRQGIAAREQGQDDKALKIFHDAWERFRTPRTQAQMGMAEQALGRWVDAETDLDGALAVSADPWIVTNRATLEAALAVIRQHLGSIEVSTNTPETEVVVDGRSVGKLPFVRPVRAPAGSALVEVRAPGYSPVQRSIQVVAGQLTRENFVLTPLQTPSAPAAAPSPVPASVLALPPAPPAEVQRGRGWPRAIFYGTAAATVLVAGLATWSGVDTLSARDRYVDDPTESGYRNGVSRQQRTNWLLGGTAFLGVSSAVIGLFATDWSTP